jgi:chromosomal replication initiation ATPase DnaA
MISTSGPLWRKLEAQMAYEKEAASRESADRHRRRIEKTYAFAIRQIEQRALKRQRSLATETQFRRVERIKLEVAKKHGVRVLDILSASRNVKLVAARQEAMFRAATETIGSYPWIGRRFNRDHTTVIHSLRAYARSHGIEPPRGLTSRKGECQPESVECRG